jgi:putative acetyltransferase
MDATNIEIRRCEPNDYSALQRIHSQPKAIWGTLQLPFPSAEGWKKRLAEQTDGTYLLVGCIDGEVVGSFSIVLDRSPRRRHVGGIGMSVHDAWHRRGVGRALIEAGIDLADNWLNLIRLELDVFADNAAAIKLYERVGFEIEGRHRKFGFRDGEFADAFSMARLR